jgi:hypothetical protein
MSEAPDDLRESLKAAFDGDEGGAAPAAPVEAVTAAPVAPTPEADGPVRDEHGRFAPKEGVKPADTQTIPTTPAQAAPEAQPEPIRPPASWSAQAKADFATLPQHIQQEVLKRETDVSKGFEERATQLKRYEPLEQVIAPHRDRLALAGTDEASYVRSLIAADEMLRGPNPIQALAQIAQLYNVDLRQLAQPGQQQQPQAQLPPQVQALEQRFQHLEGLMTQQLSAAQQAAQSQTQAEIDAFAKDHPYFENVRADMSALVREGRASNLAEAYDMACWARPDVRPLMLAEQEKTKQAQAAEAARAKVGQARQAAGSITGSPAPGSAPQRSGPDLSLRDELAQNFRSPRNSQGT